MKRTHLILAAVLAATAAAQAAIAELKLPAPLPAFKTPEQLAKWRQEMVEKASAVDEQANAKATQDADAFYTGKPYVTEIGGYAFKYRNYDSELNRWTTMDPSGFPDGVNAQRYCPVPNSQFDSDGLKTMTLRCSETWCKITSTTKLYTATAATITTTKGTSTHWDVNLGVTASSDKVVTAAVQGAVGNMNSSDYTYSVSYAWNVSGAASVKTLGMQASQYVPYIPEGMSFSQWIVKPVDAMTSSDSYELNPNSYTKETRVTEWFQWAGSYEVKE